MAVADGAGPDGIDQGCISASASCQDDSKQMGARHLLCYCAAGVPWVHARQRTAVRYEGAWKCSLEELKGALTFHVLDTGA